MKYTPEQLDFLRKGFRRLSLQELTVEFNQAFGLCKTVGQLKSSLANHKITSGRFSGSPKGIYRLMTKAQAAWLQVKYRKLSRIEVTAAFNEEFGTSLTVAQISAFTKNNRINSGRTGYFQKGENGRRGCNSVPNRTSFKKGSKPVNILPLGSERVCKKDGTILVKVAEPNPYTGEKTRYRHKHRVVWEQHHGPAPAGYVVTFLDNNKTNCDIDNLALISKQSHMYAIRNGFAGVDKDIKPTVFALAKIEARLQQLEKR